MRRMSKHHTSCPPKCRVIYVIRSGCCGRMYFSQSFHAGESVWASEARRVSVGSSSRHLLEPTRSGTPRPREDRLALESLRPASDSHAFTYQLSDLQDCLLFLSFNGDQPVTPALKTVLRTWGDVGGEAKPVHRAGWWVELHPLKIPVWASKPQFLRLWSYLETEPLQTWCVHLRSMTEG